jgi:integrase
VWCRANSRPINPRAAWGEWKGMLKAAQVRNARLHDARHTAATLLLAPGVDQRVVMEIVGHFQPQVMTDAAERIGKALWGQT